MNCLRCGKEVSLQQVFCNECSEHMEKHPVAPGTPVLIVPRGPKQPDRDPRRKRQGYADTVRNLRKAVRNLAIALSAAVLIIGLLTACLIHNLNQQAKKDLLGKNYTTVDTNQPT